MKLTISPYILFIFSTIMFNLLIIIILNLFSDNDDIWFISESDSINCFVSWQCVDSCFFISLTIIGWMSDFFYMTIENVINIIHSWKWAYIFILCRFWVIENLRCVWHLFCCSYSQWNMVLNSTVLSSG